MRGRPSKPSLTYKQAGVDILRMDFFKEQLRPMLGKSSRKEVLRDIGGFGGLFAFPRNKFKEPVLVSSADGVGTKLKVAILANRHQGVGIDVVAMNVNDILCVGAEPLFFLDYLAFSKLKEELLLEILGGINAGCKQAGCALLGGETAQMPGMYKPGEYDLAGFCVGVVEQRNIIDGAKIWAGDIVIGLASNGLHSNGFSLVRRVLSQREMERMSQELLKPTRIYVQPILSLLLANRRTGRLANSIKGIAHITGGAFYDKIARILPDNIKIRIRKSLWQVPDIFRLIQNKGGIEDKEMYHTFNMGVGMVLLVRPDAARAILSKLSSLKVKSWIIGEAVKGKREVEIV